MAANVGDSEISLHQINQVLSRAPMPDASRETVQQATASRLRRA